MFVPLSAKPRPSKKAKLNKPADDNPAIEPERTPDPFEPNDDAILDDPPPQDHEIEVEHMEVDLMIHDDKPPSPTKVVDDKTDDVIVTSDSYTAPGNPTALSKHSAKEEFSDVDKGNWKADLESYAHLSAQDIHSGILNHLYMMKE